MLKDRLTFKKYIRTILVFVIGVLGAASFSYTADLALREIQNEGLGFTRTFFGGILFLVFVLFFARYINRYVVICEDVKSTKRRVIYASVFSALLGVSFIIGYQLKSIGHTTPGLMGKLIVLILGIGLGIFIFPFADSWFRFIERKEFGDRSREYSLRIRPVLTFFIALGVIIAAYVPAFLAYYPAIMSYDFNKQSLWAKAGYAYFNTHHPPLHTMSIRLSFLLGESLGDVKIGLAIFSGIQVLVLVLVFAYAVSMILRITKRYGFAIVVCLFFAILPIHPVLALSITKDIYFTAFTLLFVLLLIEKRWAFNRKDMPSYKMKNILLSIALVFDGILMIQFRNNAIYGLALFSIIYIIWAKKERIPALILCVLIIGGGFGTSKLVQNLCGSTSGSRMEMFSVPMQQLAHVGKNQAGNLSEEDEALVNFYIPEGMYNEYNRYLADTIKISISGYYSDRWLGDIKGVLQNWLKIGLHYPSDYIDAFLDLTSGYYFLDDFTHAEVLGYGDTSDLGLLYTFNASDYDWDGEPDIKINSILPGVREFYSKIVNGNAYYGWPVVNVLFKPAFYVWLMILELLSLMFLRRGRDYGPCFVIVSYFLTLLLGPVVNFRYVYPIVAVVPVFLAFIFMTGNEDDRKELRL